MSPRPVPPTVLRARQFNLRFNTASIICSLSAPLLALIGPLLLFPGHEGLVVGVGLLVSMGMILAPVLLWGGKQREAQRILAAWARIESEEQDAVLERQLRLESMVAASPARARLRELAR